MASNANYNLFISVIGKDNASGVFGKVNSALGDMAKVAAGVAVGGLAALAGGLALSVKEAMAAEQVQAQLNAVLKSTQGIAGVTSEAANTLADSLSRVTAYEDDTILAGENMLLTFTNIGKDIFPAATETILDMSTAMGTDLKSSAIQLGKALQDPISGVGALSRVGVNFTDAQKDMIKKLVESGDVMGAQKLILAELKTEFGGAAKAAGQTFGGQLTILQNAFGNIMEEIGGAFLPMLTDLAKWVNKEIVPAIKTWAVDAMPKIIAKLKEFALWAQKEVLPVLRDLALWIFRDVVPALRLLAKWIQTDVIPALKQFGAWIKTDVLPMIQKLVDWFTKELPKAQKSTNDVFKKIQDAIQGAWNFIKPILDKIFDVLSKFWTEIQPKLQKAWDNIQAQVKAAWDAIWKIIQPIVLAIQKFIDDHMEEIKKIWDAAWTIIYNVVKVIWNLISGFVKVVLDILGGDMEAAGKDWNDTMAKVWEGIKAIFSAAWTAIQTAAGLALAALWQAISGKMTEVYNTITEIWASIITYITNLATSFWNAGVTIITSLVNAVISVIGGVGTAVENAINGVVTWLGERAASFWNSGVAMINALIGGIQLTALGIWNAITTPIQNAWNWITSLNWWQVGVDIFQGIIGGLGSIKDQLVGVLRGPIQALIDLINRLLNTLGIGSGAGLAQINLSPVMAGRGAQGIGGAGSSAMVTNNYNLTIHSQATTEQVRADFGMMRALAGA